MRVINTRTRTPAHTQRQARQRHTDRHKKSLHTFLGCGELRAKHIRRGNLYVPICPVCVSVCVCVSVWVNVFMYVCMCVCMYVLAWVCPPLAARQKHKLDFFLSLRVAIHVDVCVCVYINSTNCIYIYNICATRSLIREGQEEIERQTESERAAFNLCKWEARTKAKRGDNKQIRN